MLFSCIAEHNYDISGVNDAKQLFAQKSRSLDTIPPTKAALEQHQTRASYSATAGICVCVPIHSCQILLTGDGPRCDRVAAALGHSSTRENIVVLRTDTLWL